MPYCLMGYIALEVGIRDVIFIIFACVNQYGKPTQCLLDYLYSKEEEVESWPTCVCDASKKIWRLGPYGSAIRREDKINSSE